VELKRSRMPIAWRKGLWHNRREFARPLFSGDTAPMKVLSFLLAAVFLLSPQVETQAQTASDAPVVETSIGTLGPFEKWLEGVRQEARGQGISESTLHYALRDIRPIARIIELDRRQPEFTLTLDQYLDRTIPASRVAKARRKFAENRELLEELQKKYQVPGRFVVALWGIESDFGNHTGGFSVVNALATLAHDGRRSAYFRKELINALKIIDQGHVTPEDMVGSWAGAMGQAQFMPSTFLRHAIDHDGDGRIDIWNSSSDALASGANYLRKAGWNQDLTWGREVTLPEGFDPGLAGKDKPRYLSTWDWYGVKRADGSPLPKRAITGAIIFPERQGGEGGPTGRAFLVYDNFPVILDWNRSNFFAIAVGQLADQIN